MSTFLQQGIRTAGSSSLQTVDIADMISFINAVDFRLVVDGNDVERLHLVASDDSYYSIKVGDTATITGDGVDRIKSLINSNVIYCGESANGVWFTFGKRPSGNASATVVSVASLFGTPTGAKVVVA